MSCLAPFLKSEIMKEDFQTDTIMQDLRIKIEQLTEHNMSLEAQVIELLPFKLEVTQLKCELNKLQKIEEKNNVDIQKLTFENETLRNRLRDVVSSPLSDAEKHKIIQDSQRLHHSAPASIALPSITDNDGQSIMDWDKHSSGSGSEVSVACLQDKIIQMEETHYSTNEELQATLQELSDLQDQLLQLQQYNERLSEEKNVLFQSLCRQTEKLEELQEWQEVFSRKSNQAEVCNTEREKKLLDVLKTSQEERDQLLVKQKEYDSEIYEKIQTLEIMSKENKKIREKMCLLDSTIDAANAEKRQIEMQLSITKEDNSKKNIEISRLNTLLDNARSKLEEFKHDCERGEKTDLEELLTQVRREKDLLEIQSATLQEKLSNRLVEIQKFQDQIVSLNEELKVSRNNAKCAVSHLEYKYDEMKEAKKKLLNENQLVRDQVNELKIQCKCHIEEKFELNAILSEKQQQLTNAESEIKKKCEQLDNEKKLRKKDAEEWQLFQNDLLMTVRVANDFKTEAQVDREQLVLDNNTLHGKIRLLEQQLDKLNIQTSSADTQSSILSSVQQEITARRHQKITTKQDSRHSVKSLIENIEGNKQQEELSSTQNSTRCSTNLSTMKQDEDLAEESKTPSRISVEWQENWNNLKKSPATSFCLSTNSKLLLGVERDPLNALTKNGGSKRNALLKWCQNKTVGYRNIDITNFSSSWNDGLAFCAIMHSYLPDQVPYDTLNASNKRRNFSLAFSAAETVGIPTILNINEMCNLERPDWTQIMTYITSIYVHFES
ncbi:SPECC1 family protein [Megaselia abdita]